MKKLLFLLITPTIFACTNEEKPVELPTKAIISGQVLNPKEESVKLSNGEDKFEVKLTDGKFSLEIDIDEAGYYNFGHGSESAQMYIEPGDNIAITFDPVQFDETISYSGKGAEESNYLISKFLLEESKVGNFAEFSKADEVTFVDKLETIKSDLNQHLSTYVEQHPKVNKDFVRIQEVDILYGWANLRNRYERYHRHYTEDDKFKVSKSYYDFSRVLDADKPENLASVDYKNYIINYYDKLARKTYDNKDGYKNNKTTGWLKCQLATFEDQVKSPKVRNYLTYNALKDQISFAGTEGIVGYLASFNKSSSNSKHTAELKQLYNKWTVLSKGSPAPGFVYDDIEGNEVALKDFIGKNVYIDVWASWCGPCKKELPHLEELQHAYKGNENIVFASVSIDEDKEAWAKMVKEKEMMGVQLIANKAWSSGICKDYLIRGIPRFILVNTEGRIIDSKAPRPSSNEIKDILKDLTKPVLTTMK